MSKTVGASALAIIAVAGTAMAAAPFQPVPADQRGIWGQGLLSADQYTLTDKIIGGSTTRSSHRVYDGIEFTSPYYAPTGAVGYVAFDDYQTTNSPGGQFGGGTDFMSTHEILIFTDTGADATTLVFFTFFTASGGFFDSYGVLLPADGIFHYYGVTISGGGAGGMYIPSDGIIQVYVNDGTFTAYGSNPTSMGESSQLVPVAGTNSLAFGSHAPDSMMHAILVPAPASLAMLGLGGALAIRRRR